jgi:hypothetical protein
MKTYKVEGANWERDVILNDKDLGGNVYLEAATRAVEWASKNLEDFNLGYIVSVKDVNDDDEGNVVMITSYVVLINAGMYEIAEQMRNDILEHDGIDVKPKNM